MPVQYGEVTRRRLLTMGVTAAAGAVAGCLSSDAETEDADTAPHQIQFPDESAERTSYSHIHDDAISPAPAEHATVKMVTTEDRAHLFAPHVVWIEPGGTVTWELERGAHNATAYHPDHDRPLRIPDEATPFDSGRLVTPGATFEHTFEVAGVYDYYCAPHEGDGMVGSILVGEPDVHQQPGLEPPQQRLESQTHQRIVELNGLVEGILST